MNDWWSEVIKFNDAYFPGWRMNREPIFFSNALAGEVGEVCGLVKKFYGGGTNNPKMPLPSEIVEEAVDVFIYLVLLSECLEHDELGFDTVFTKKIMKLEKRMQNRTLEDTAINTINTEEKNA